MDSFLVLKRHIKALFQGSQNAATRTRIGQEEVGIGEQELTAFLLVLAINQAKQWTAGCPLVLMAKRKDVRY